MRASDKALYAKFGIDPTQPRHSRISLSLFALGQQQIDVGDRLRAVYAERRKLVEGCQACRHGWRCGQHPHSNVALERFVLAELAKLDSDRVVA